MERLPRFVRHAVDFGCFMSLGAVAHSPSPLF
jgi:hypothetical protein